MRVFAYYSPNDNSGSLESAKPLSTNGTSPSQDISELKQLHTYPYNRKDLMDFEPLIKSGVIPNPDASILEAPAKDARNKIDLWFLERILDFSKGQIEGISNKILKAQVSILNLLAGDKFPSEEDLPKKTFPLEIYPYLKLDAENYIDRDAEGKYSALLQNLIIEPRLRQILGKDYKTNKNHDNAMMLKQVRRILRARARIAEKEHPGTLESKVILLSSQLKNKTLTRRAFGATGIGILLASLTTSYIKNKSAIIPLKDPKFNLPPRLLGSPYPTHIDLSTMDFVERFTKHVVSTLKNKKLIDMNCQIRYSVASSLEESSNQPPLILIKFPNNSCFLTISGTFLRNLVNELIKENAQHEVKKQEPIFNKMIASALKKIDIRNK